METFTVPKELVDNPHYPDQRQKSLAGLSDETIDGPIIALICAFNRLPYCFTMQCCYGHFVYPGQNDAQNIEPLPITDSLDSVEYRIAYICLCVENSDAGKRLLEVLKQVPAIDPPNIQFCCAEWFWDRQVNSFALQVQPERFKNKDTAVLEYREALHIEQLRNHFFEALKKSLAELPAGRPNQGGSDAYLA